MIGARSRSYLHGVPKVSTFTHHNKLTSRIVSKPLMDLTILNPAFICTPTPNLMGVIQSESMISQAFQACYSIEGCPSDRCILSHERVEYMVVTKITITTLRINSGCNTQVKTRGLIESRGRKRMIQLVKRKDYRRVSTVYIPMYYEVVMRRTYGRHKVC